MYFFPRKRSGFRDACRDKTKLGVGMIAKWIAQAMMRGEDHLKLSKEELAMWQANGCRVGFGAPYGMHGQYIVRQIFWWQEQLIKQLTETEPSSWPVGAITLEAHGNKRTVSMPEHDFQLGEEGMWIVPLLPKDIDHCLNAWAFDIALTDEESEAVAPFAFKLAKRMAVRCEIQGRQEAEGKDVLWNKGRLALADLAGLDYIRLHVWFDKAMRRSHTLPINSESIDSDDCVEIWKNEQSRLREISYRQETLNGPRELKRDGDVVNEVQFRHPGGQRDLFEVRFTGSHSNTRPLENGVATFILNLSRSELTKLKEFIEQSLGLTEVPLPVYPDIAMGVETAARKRDESATEPVAPDVSKLADLGKYGDASEAQ
jgi:hypothetical protein